MLDPKLIRNEAPLIAEQLRIKGYQLDVSRLTELESQRKPRPNPDQKRLRSSTDPFTGASK